ncbi:MAG: prepilin-type N-terminal cleavage/methylation domain-containing protein [Proteobacteria bacterium]|nr:prepilin-type N-terminal cleavage/methylation domain-containing protein [Pseudomonadota bacterium]
MARKREAGFTILEVLVALVIAALALGALFSGAISGLRSAQLSVDYADAVARARSHLAVVGIGAPMVAMTQEGDDGDGFRWRLRIRPLATITLASQADALAAAGTPPPRVALYSVSVVITWTKDGGMRQVQLKTERIGTAPPARP